MLLLVEPPRPHAGSTRYRNLAKRAGFSVLTANSGPMMQVISRRSCPDLVLLLPFIGRPSASELARIIKEDPRTKEIPVLILVDCDKSDPDIAMVYPTEACASVATTDEDLVKTMLAIRKRRVNGSLVPEPSSALEGDLGDDIFPDVLHFLLMARKTGRVVVLDGGRRPGYIYIEDGDVMHSELVQHRGMEAFSRIAFLNCGRFKFEPEFRSAQRTVNKRGIEALLDSARLHDERFPLKDIPSMPTP